jgi:predicted RNA binding protein YcfA (HicA-like mRNA interferase family)
MPKLRRVSGEEAIRALERLGFRQVRQRGSHVILRRETAQGSVGCVVPLHRELAIRSHLKTLCSPLKRGPLT